MAEGERPILQVQPKTEAFGQQAVLTQSYFAVQDVNVLHIADPNNARVLRTIPLPTDEARGWVVSTDEKEILFFGPAGRAPFLVSPSTGQTSALVQASNLSGVNLIVSNKHGWFLTQTMTGDLKTRTKICKFPDRRGIKCDPVELGTASVLEVVISADEKIAVIASYRGGYQLHRVALSTPRPPQRIAGISKAPIPGAPSSHGAAALGLWLNADGSRLFVLAGSGTRKTLSAWRTSVGVSRPYAEREGNSLWRLVGDPRRRSELIVEQESSKSLLALSSETLIETGEPMAVPGPVVAISPSGRRIHQDVREGFFVFNANGEQLGRAPRPISGTRIEGVVGNRVLLSFGESIDLDRGELTASADPFGGERLVVRGNVHVRTFLRDGSLQVEVGYANGDRTTSYVEVAPHFDLGGSISPDGGIAVVRHRRLVKEDACVLTWIRLSDRKRISTERAPCRVSFAVWNDGTVWTQAERRRDGRRALLAFTPDTSFQAVEKSVVGKLDEELEELSIHGDHAYALYKGHLVSFANRDFANITLVAAGDPSSKRTAKLTAYAVDTTRHRVVAARSDGRLVAYPFGGKSSARELNASEEVCNASFYQHSSETRAWLVLSSHGREAFSSLLGSAGGEPPEDADQLCDSASRSAYVVADSGAVVRISTVLGSKILGYLDSSVDPGDCRALYALDRGESVLVECVESHPTRDRRRLRFSAFPTRSDLRIDELNAASLPSGSIVSADLATAAIVIEKNGRHEARWIEFGKVRSERFLEQDIRRMSKSHVRASYDGNVLSAFGESENDIHFWGRGQSHPTTRTVPSFVLFTRWSAGTFGPDGSSYYLLFENGALEIPTTGGSANVQHAFLADCSKLALSLRGTVVCGDRVRSVTSPAMEPLPAPKPLAVLRDAGPPVDALYMLQEPQSLVVAGESGLHTIWDLEQGEELVSFWRTTRHWGAVAPDGRFAISDFHESVPVSWVLPGQPLEAIPVEAFLREYHEPDLLQKLFHREKLRTLPPLGTLDRTLPKVVEIRADRLIDQAGLVGVQVETSMRVSGTGQGKSAVSEVRLFRDGQLVGSLSEPTENKSSTQIWAFNRIQLGSYSEKTVFTAYAFNRDGVKGETASLRFAHAQPIKRKRRAFIVSVGVDHSTDPKNNLRFAARDAELAVDALRHALDKSYSEVIVQLIQSPAKLGPRPGLKAELKAALADLAHGKNSRVAATPDDSFFFLFSGHGALVDEREFAMVMPSSYSLSDENLVTVAELADWVRDIDVGTMNFIFDACYSGGAVGTEYRPGPLSSRSFGQLAYDKNMRLLAATQADSIAREHDALKRGLLNHVLFVEGLTAKSSDDKTISVGAWMRNARARVSELHRALLRTDVEERAKESRPSVLVPASRQDGGLPSFQTPLMFDFSKFTHEDKLLLVETSVAAPRPLATKPFAKEK